MYVRIFGLGGEGGEGWGGGLGAKECRASCVCVLVSLDISLAQKGQNFHAVFM